MTEADWMTCTSPEPMLELVRGSATDRKLRLFAIAACWQCRDANCGRSAHGLEVLAVAERYADGEATDQDLRRARALALTDLEEATSVARRYQDYSQVATCNMDAADLNAAMAGADADLAAAYHHMTDPDAFTAAGTVASALEGVGRKEIACELLREVFGNPFRTQQIDPSWLSWNESTVSRLARRIYQDRLFALIPHVAPRFYDEGEFLRMPVLAEALKKAGCRDEQMIAHCEQPRCHVRGCWVLDLCLGNA